MGESDFDDAATPVTGPRRPGDCPLVVNFGSIGTGIDRRALQRVEALLAGDPAVTAVERSHFGREGETSLCIRLPAEAVGRLFEAIKAAVLAERGDGPVRIRTLSGLEFQRNRDD